MESITIDRKIIVDLARIIEELQDRIESLELASDTEFMKSLKKSDEEVKNRDFVDWNDL